jgi:hypothetical protein
MQNAYRSALKSQKILNSSFHREQVGYSVGYKDELAPRGGESGKSYLPPNPIVYPVSDPMYNPYLRNDIKGGVSQINR